MKSADSFAKSPGHVICVSGCHEQIIYLEFYLPLALSINMWVGMISFQFVPTVSMETVAKLVRPCESPHLQSLLECNRIWKVEASFHCQNNQPKNYWFFVCSSMKPAGSFMETAGSLRFLKELEVGLNSKNTTQQWLITKSKNHTTTRGCQIPTQCRLH